MIVKRFKTFETIGELRAFKKTLTKHQWVNSTVTRTIAGNHKIQYQTRERAKK